MRSKTNKKKELFISAMLTFFTVIFNLSNICYADDDLNNWRSAGHDHANSSNNQLEQLISPSTVTHFGFEKKLFSNLSGYNDPQLGAYESYVLTVPVIYNGIVYYADIGGTVYGIDILSGKTLFKTPVSQARESVEMQYNNTPYHMSFESSPVVTSKYLFIADTESVLYKLDRFTGKILGSVQTGDTMSGLYDYNDLYYTGSLIYYNNVNPYESQGDINYVSRENDGKSGLVILGLSSQDTEDMAMGVDPTRGAIVGVNADNMKIEWKAFLTSDQNLITNPKPRWGGGVNSWAGMAIDKSRRLVYIGTSSRHSPPPHYKGSPTDNTPDYVDSLVAINYNTGQIVDHFQLVKEDYNSGCYAIGSFLCDPSTEPSYSLSDPNRNQALGPYNIPADVDTEIFTKGFGNYAWDVSQGPQLFQIKHGNKNIDVVGVAGKQGIYYALDRDNLNTVYWKTSPPASDTIPQANPAANAGAASDFANSLIWYPYEYYDQTYTVPGVAIEALDMNTGEVKAIISLPNEFMNGTVSIANNILYVAGGASGYLSLYDISHCCDVNHQPKLIYQDQVSIDPSNNGVDSSIRAVSIVNGKIFVGFGALESSGNLGGLAIYSLKGKP